MEKTLVVSFWGGPGNGKSTFAHGLMWQLKTAGISCEFAAEYAKDVVFEESLKKLDNQIYIFGKQLQRMKRLNHKVNVIVTDSPLLVSIVYDRFEQETLKNLALEEYKKFNNLNFLIERSHTYSEQGRIQNEKAAKAVHLKMVELLEGNNLSYHKMTSEPENVFPILDIVKNQLDNMK